MARSEPRHFDRGAVEVFHLLFLRALLVGPTEKAHMIVKGGCNLRFFHGSIRYSEDLDLDVATIAPRTLQKNVEKVLSGPVLGRALQASGLRVSRFNAAKQTETTQRWKVQIETEDARQLPTKVEFSRRGGDEDAELAAVDRQILDAYRLPAVHARHYLAGAAIHQKIQALASRDVAQARDVFDLDLLFTKVIGQPTALRVAAGVLEAARERALGLSYDAYVAQVVAYLEPEQQAPYHARESWEAMQLHVVQKLESGLR